jgi:chorismate mutase
LKKPVPSGSPAALAKKLSIRAKVAEAIGAFKMKRKLSTERCIISSN